MGGAVSKDTKVSKEQALSAVADAFEGTPRSGVVTIEDIVNVAVASNKIRPTRLDRWNTTTSDMQKWSLKAHHKVHHSPRPNPDNPLLSGGRLLAGTPRSDMKLLSATTLPPGISWKAALDASPMPRDKRMSKIRTMFDAWDNNGDSVVTEAEFVSALAEEGIAEREACKLFRSMDDSHSRRLTVAKFDHYVAMHTLAMVRDSFKSLDSSKDRQIQQKEFTMYFMGNGLSKHQARRLWDDIDKNRNGKINFVEYRDWGLDVLEGNSLHQVAMSLGLSAGG